MKNKCIYNLGNMIIGQDLPHLIKRRDQIINDYPNSIVSKYWKSTDKWCDIDTLSEVVSKENEEPVVGVINLRLGDKVENKSFDIQKCVDSVVESACESSNSNWKIQTGFHNSPKNLSTSFKIIEKIYIELENSKRNRISVHINDADSVDKVFIEACTTKNLIVGGAGGTWHRLIKEIRNRSRLETIHCKFK